MDEAKRELVQTWLTKADQDLAAAEILAAAPRNLLGAAIYHCQQAAEKALKGFLVYHDQRFEMTHDIEVLVRLAVQYGSGFAPTIARANQLTRYATAFRYPGLRTEPTRHEFDTALANARAFYALVTSLLPPAVHP